MDLSKLKEFIELMNRHRLAEMEIEQDGLRIRLRKEGERIKEVVAYPGAIPAGSPAPSSAPAAETAPETGNVIKSPMVGTFYRSPNPDADAFVEVGDRIQEGTVLCIVEAMKVMNEVKAETSGTIEAILVENGQSIEYGQPLFRIS